MKSLVILAGAALAFATPAAAQELVTNGGFETGSLSGFTQTGTTSFSGVGSGLGTGGSFGAFFGAVGTTGGISQSLATTAGQSYLISFALQSDGGTPNFYQVLFGGTQLFTGTNVGAFGLTTFSTTATATGGSTNLAFSFRDDPGFFILDNVSVTAVTGAVPEPATWMMMLLGFGAIGFSVRRRRKATAALA